MMARFVLFACLLAGRAAVAAAPPQVIQLDVELEQLDREEDLGWSDGEPIGLEVTPTASKYWFQIGCRPGDVIERIDEARVSTLQMNIAEGLHTFDLWRGGKPVILRVLAHGPQFRTQHITANEAAELTKQIHELAAGTLAVPLKRSPGVRIIQFGSTLNLELRPGDILRTIDGARVETEADLVRVLKAIPIGHTDVVLIRDGRTITVTWEREP